MQYGRQQGVGLDSLLSSIVTYVLHTDRISSRLSGFLFLRGITCTEWTIATVCLTLPFVFRLV